MALSASPWSLKDQLAFYGAYHANHVNIFIHIVFVPLIWMSMLALLMRADVTLDQIALYLPSPLQVPLHELSTQLAKALPASVYQHVNIGSILSLLYLGYYAILDLGTATLITPLWAAYYCAAWALVEYVPDSRKWATYVFFTSWVAQFYGHGVHEGRAPALLDNLLGALVLAPLFVFIEVLFSFGYRPELQRWLKNKTSSMLLEFRKERAAAKRAKAQ